jgi:glycosyltransferase involved in cell wall biosynthesis
MPELNHPELNASTDRRHDPVPRARSSLQVSVIIPAFMAAGHITVALDSVLAQTVSPYEILVINDGSPDGDQLEKALQPYLSRVIYLTQENGGPSAARNAGIRRSTSEWIAFLDSDDAWLPKYLEQQLEFLQNDPSVDMAYCNATLEGESIPDGKTYMDICPSVGPVTFESVLVERTQVLTSGTVVRRNKLVAAGLFDESLRCSEDHDLWLRILHGGGKVSYHSEVLVTRRVRSDSQGAVPGGLLAGEIQSLKKLERDLDLTPGRRELLGHRLREIEAHHAAIEGKNLLLAGVPDKAYESLNRAYMLRPNAKLRAMLVGLKIAPRLTIMSARFWRRRTSSLRQA